MDFNNSLDVLCNFCHQPIAFASVDTYSGEHFCHLACAKLYYDNVDKIKLNFRLYQRAYTNQQLSPLAVNIYEKLEGTLFNMLPIGKCDITNPIKCRDDYVETLLKIKKIIQ